MTHGALRVSALALGAAALVSLSPLSAASAATVVHHPAHAVHGRAGHAYGRVAHAHGHHYVWRNGHRYAYGYGYNPGAAVVGGVLGAAAAYPYDCGGYAYGPYDGSCSDYGYGSGYPYYGYGYGYGGYGGYGHGFHGGGAHFAGGNFGRMGGFGGGHF